MDMTDNPSPSRFICESEIQEDDQDEVLPPVQTPAPTKYCCWPLNKTAPYEWCNRERAKIGTRLPYCVEHAYRARARFQYPDVAKEIR
jgi:hypothetical protein